jgi:hypothetical protein
MPTTLELKQKIGKLEKGLTNKALSTTAKTKLKTQIQSLKKDLEKLKKAKTPQDRIAEAKALALKIRRTQQGVPTGKSDIEKDATRKAMKTVKRVSQGLRANQYGSKADSKGNIYYEKRDNRFDRKPEKYARLEHGGMMARGGYVSKGEMVWRKLNSSERIDFLYKNFTPQITPRSQEILVGRDYNFLPKNVKIVMESKYANVEEYAKGGKTNDYKSKFNVDDVVYNKTEKTVGIVRIADDKYGEAKTDADGNVDIDNLEHYNPLMYPHQYDFTIAPSTKKEIEQRNLWKPFREEKYAKGGEVFYTEKHKND